MDKATDSPLPASLASDRSEREIDDLLRDFQIACEDAYANGRSEDSITPTAKHRAILRNELRARLLAASSLAPGPAAEDETERHIAEIESHRENLTVLGAVREDIQWLVSRFRSARAENERLLAEKAEANDRAAEYEEERNAAGAEVLRLCAQNERLMKERDDASGILRRLLEKTGSRGAQQVSGFYARGEIQRAVDALGAAAQSAERATGDENA
jgi:hypothetical protein